MSTINGSGAATQNRTNISFTPRIGGEYGGRFEGPAAAVLTQMNTLIALGYAVQYEQDQSPIASCTFTTTTGNGTTPTDPNLDYTDNFQISRNTVQKEILMSDHPLVAGLTAANMKTLKRLMQNPSEATYASGNIADQWTGTSDQKAVGQYLFDLFQSGVRSIEVKQPVLRVTRVTNPLYDAPFDLTYVDRFLTTSRMISDSGVPSNFAVPLAALASALMRQHTFTTPGDVTSYVVRNDVLTLKFGWLKDVITNETLGTSKNQYILEYSFGLYDTLLKGALVT
jgi:hypothetical protein